MQWPKNGNPPRSAFDLLSFVGFYFLVFYMKFMALVPFFHFQVVPQADNVLIRLEELPKVWCSYMISVLGKYRMLFVGFSTHESISSVFKKKKKIGGWTMYANPVDSAELGPFWIYTCTWCWIWILTVILSFINEVKKSRCSLFSEKKEGDSKINFF